MRAKGLCHHKHEPVCASYQCIGPGFTKITTSNIKTWLMLWILLIGMKTPDSSSILADTHYYLDSTTVSSMIVDKFCN